MWVLIGRGLDHMLCGLQKRKHSLCSILRLHLRKLTGADGDEATPVPIPNTEVKLISVENTWLATAWEDRAVPVQTQKGLNVQTFLAYCPLAQSVEHLTVNQGVASSSLAGAATKKPAVTAFVGCGLFVICLKNSRLRSCTNIGRLSDLAAKYFNLVVDVGIGCDVDVLMAQ